MEINRLFSVKGKTAIVTGGSRGIGASISNIFSKHSCQIELPANFMFALRIFLNAMRVAIEVLNRKSLISSPVFFIV